MKKLFTLILVSSALTAFCQSTAGLIAHWDMNGTVTDVSGNGHNGHANNVVPVPGESGMANTAYYFNGINSVITAPYLPDLNTNTYSICAVVKVMGFYTGYCQTSTIITRGLFNAIGNYYLMFYDNPFDGDNCTLMDTTKDVFTTSTGDYGAFSISLRQYTPAISEDIWYKVVATWDGSQYRTYINGILKNLTPPTTGSYSTNTDSISIGMDIFDSSLGNPYQFKGIIDDIEIYNRVLTDSEIVHYGDTCGAITTEPSSYATVIGHNALFTVSTSFSAPAYQWQQDAGLGFVALTNSGPYSGVNTNTLTISGVSAAVNDDHYRCVISSLSGCSDTTTSALLTTTPSGIKNLITNDMIYTYPNPSNNNIIIKLPDGCGKVDIQLFNNVGQIITEQNNYGNPATFNLQALSPGVYTLKIKLNDQVIYKKILKE